MSWEFKSDQFAMVVDANTGAKLIKQSSAQMDFLLFYFDNGHNIRRFSLRILPQQIAEPQSGEHHEGVPAALLLDADAMNWVASPNDVKILKEVYSDKDFNALSENEINTLLVRYVIGALVTLNKSILLANPPHSVFYSSYAQRSATGKKYNYIMPSNGELRSISSRQVDRTIRC